MSLFSGVRHYSENCYHGTGFPKFNEGDGIPGYRAKWLHLIAKDKMLIVTAMNSKAKAVI